MSCYERGGVFEKTKEDMVESISRSLFIKRRSATETWNNQKASGCAASGNGSQEGGLTAGRDGPIEAHFKVLTRWRLEKH